MKEEVGEEEDGSEDEDEDEGEAGEAGGDGGVQYSDFGLTRSERKAMRERSSLEEQAFETEREDAGEGVGYPASLQELEKICLTRQTFEKWFLEPFFADAVCGCLVRVVLREDSLNSGQGFYRVAEVLAVQDDEIYMLGNKKTCKRLQLNFGDHKQLYPMSSTSNKPFQDLELLSWMQVLNAAGQPSISQAHVQRKCKTLEKANNYIYTEADVRRKVEEETLAKALASKGAPVLTTRQKKVATLQSRAGAGPRPADLAARPLKFHKTAAGHAIVEQDDS